MMWALLILVFTGDAAVSKPAQLFQTPGACQRALAADFAAGLRQPLDAGQGRLLKCEPRP